MRLTDFTDYSLRVLIYLALHDDGRATVDEISDAYGVSRHHLSKVVQKLGRQGWIDSVRGRCGGLRLAANVQEVSIGTIVRATEKDFALVGCQGGDGHGACVIEQQCRLNGLFVMAREAFLQELDRYTVSDLATPAAPLALALKLIPISVENECS